MRRYILGFSKGLLEIVGGSAWGSGSQWLRVRDELQVIHESMREFLLTEGLALLLRLRGDENANRYSEAIARSHERPKKICFDEGFRRHEEFFRNWTTYCHLKPKEREEYRSGLPLLAYAPNAVYHANEAHREGSSVNLDFDQTKFLDQLEQAEVLNRW